MENITVVINASQSASLIKDCVESARLLTPHILVYVTNSTDDTAARARELGAQVVEGEQKTLYVEPVRAAAIAIAKTPWVFILDTDERMTSELCQEIQSTIQSTKYTHFKVPRKNIFGGKKHLKYGGWWPDEQLRLINKNFLIEWPVQIHSTPKIDGDLGHLKEAFVHHFHGDIGDMVRKTVVYEGIEAQLLAAAGRNADVRIFMRKFLGELYRRMVARAGFLDGTYGIIESIYQAYSKTITYLFVYEMSLNGKSKDEKQI